jgi:hypothetical protein
VVSLVENPDKDNEIYTVEPLGKVVLDPEQTGAYFKQEVCRLYNETKSPKQELTLDQFRLRNPQNDFGSVV